MSSVCKADSSFVCATLDKLLNWSSRGQFTRKKRTNTCRRHHMDVQCSRFFPPARLKQARQTMKAARQANRKRACEWLPPPPPPSCPRNVQVFPQRTNLRLCRFKHLWKKLPDCVRCIDEPIYHHVRNVDAFGPDHDGRRGSKSQVLLRRPLPKRLTKRNQLFVRQRGEIIKRHVRHPPTRPPTHQNSCARLWASPRRANIPAACAA